MRVLFSLTVAMFFLASCSSIDTMGANISEIRDRGHQMDGKLPIIYSPEYNMSFLGVERLHPFDTYKYKRVLKRLNSLGIVSEGNYYEPLPPDDSVLLRHHSPEYLEEIKQSSVISEFTQIWPIRFLPDSVAYNRIMMPMRYASAGTILAAELALEYGWAINLGGGYHHASRDIYTGFSAISDVTLAILHARDNHPDLERVMIIDLDAHQGNGHERDFLNDESVFILDIYNVDIYPGDRYAKQGIDVQVELRSYTEDAAYLSALEDALDEAFARFDPQLIVYVAGTDILAGDRLGDLSVSPDGVIARDAMVFDRAKTEGVPIMMVLAGGYLQSSAAVIADSIAQIASSR